MCTKESAPERETAASKRYLVKCDGCSFARPAEGRDAATEIGTAHHHETRHEVVIAEVPPTMHAR